MPSSSAHDEEEEEPYDPTKYNPDDPIWQDHLWLQTEQVRYGDGAQGAGMAYYSGYNHADKSLAGNHTRGILLLHTGASQGDDADASSEVSLRSFANKLALSCECVALAPFLRGGASQWPPERLAAEAWAASTYLNRVCGAESLAIVAVGHATTVSTLALLNQGALGAHATVALCPGRASSVGSAAADLARAARDLPVPLLAVCGTADTGGQAGAVSLRDGLSLNSQLQSDYYVAELRRAASGDDPLPALLQDACAEEALALVQSWVDRYCPEGLGAA